MVRPRPASEQDKFFASYPPISLCDIMPRTAACKVCGALLPRHLQSSWVAWLLAAVSLILLILIPTVIGLATVEGGLLIFVSIVGAVVALYLFLRTERICQACRDRNE